MGLVVVQGVARTLSLGVRSNLKFLAAEVVVVVGVMVTMAATAVGPAAATSACVAVPVHRMLSADGGLHRLPDGRQFKASVVDVGGCPPMSFLPTGMAYPDTASNYTVIGAQVMAGAGGAASPCVTGTGLGAGGGPGGSPAVLSGFQAILIEANGFRFSADMVLEDIDAQSRVPLAEGWREMMTSLGMAGGQVVRPTLRTRAGALVGVQPFQIKAAALAAVGFPAAADMTIDGAAYNSWTTGRSTCAEGWGGGWWAGCDAPGVWTPARRWGSVHGELCVGWSKHGEGWVGVYLWARASFPVGVSFARLTDACRLLFSAALCFLCFHRGVFVLVACACRARPAAVPTDCPFMNDPTGECKATVTYEDAVDRLLLVYATTQASPTDPDSAAIFSAVTLSCGCQCAAHPRSNVAKPVAGSPGRCTTVAASTPGYSCDMLGTSWCETRVGTRWALTGDGDKCVQEPNTYSQVVSTFNPDPEFK